MANVVTIPQFGIAEDSVVLTAWYVNVGDTVAVGDRLFAIETGKSAYDVESEYAGVLLALLAVLGDEIAVQSPACVIGEAGEKVDIDRFGQSTPTIAPNLLSQSSITQATIPGIGTGMANLIDHTSQSLPTQITSAPASSPPALTQSAPTPAITPGAISPRARLLAARVGLDPQTASATGPGGRVIEHDIRALWQAEADSPPSHKAEPPAPTADMVSAAYQDKPLSVIRKTIAKNMMASLQNSAQLTHGSSFDATNIMAYRRQLKADPATADVTLTDMILYAIAQTLADFPALNAHLLGDTLRVFSAVNLAVAVDTERGLMVPVIFGASEMSLGEISAQAKVLAAQCRDGSINPTLLTGGSFTVSNLGQFGIESFTPILNSPQTGILGVGTIISKIKGYEEISAYPAMSLSLTYDHRAIDGAPASRFLQALCHKLESFTDWATT